jgi:hypothetical protein
MYGSTEDVSVEPKLINGKYKNAPITTISLLNVEVASGRHFLRRRSAGCNIKQRLVEKRGTSCKKFCKWR